MEWRDSGPARHVESGRISGGLHSGGSELRFPQTVGARVWESAPTRTTACSGLRTEARGAAGDQGLSANLRHECRGVLLAESAFGLDPAGRRKDRSIPPGW